MVKVIYLSNKSNMLEISSLHIIGTLGLFVLLKPKCESKRDRFYFLPSYLLAGTRVIDKSLFRISSTLALCIINNAEFKMA